jgi:hypothetical protein
MSVDPSEPRTLSSGHDPDPVPVVQWIVQQPSKLRILVRFQAGTPRKGRDAKAHGFCILRPTWCDRFTAYSEIKRIRRLVVNQRRERRRSDDPGFCEVPFGEQAMCVPGQFVNVLRSDEDELEYLVVRLQYDRFVQCDP